MYKSKQSVYFVSYFKSAFYSHQKNTIKNTISNTVPYLSGYSSTHTKVYLYSSMFGCWFIFIWIYNNQTGSDTLVPEHEYSQNLHLSIILYGIIKIRKNKVSKTSTHPASNPLFQAIGQVNCLCHEYIH